MLTDKWVQNCVQGLQIPFTSSEVQGHRTNPPISSAEQSSLVLVEVNTLLRKGAIALLQHPLDHKGFYSTLLLERGQDEASYPPQEAEQMGGTPALHNGRYSRIY